MKSFSNHSGSRGLPRFIKGIHWATSSFLRKVARLPLSWTSADEAVGNVKSFNNHSGSRGLLRFFKGIYWATSSPPSRRGAREVMRKNRPLAVNNVVLSVPLRSVQFSSGPHSRFISEDPLR